MVQPIQSVESPHCHQHQRMIWKYSQFS